VDGQKHEGTYPKLGRGHSVNCNCVYNLNEKYSLMEFSTELEEWAFGKQKKKCFGQ